MLAVVFPGQGSQYVGMARSLYDEFTEVRPLFEQAAEILGDDLLKLMFEGPEELLKESKNTQPAILLHSIVGYELLKRRVTDFSPAIVMGHSLGEYSALVAAGVIDFVTALKLVRRRGELMSAAGDKHPGGMAAVLGVTADVVESKIRELQRYGTIVVANYNSPMQTVISGELDMIDRAIEEFKKLGVRKVVKLKVSGAFHSPLMEEASEEFAKLLDEVEFNTPRIPIIPNATGKLTQDKEELKSALKRQMRSPVLWTQSVHEAKRFGIRRVIEVGPKKVLCGLINKIDAEIETSNLDTAEDMVKFVK